MATVNTHRFGTMTIPEEKIITMERPVLGFEQLSQFCLVESSDVAPFMWLQSCEDASISFLVVNPVLLFPNYRIEVNSKEIAELRVAKVESVETYVIVTLAEDPSQVSVNLQGPILINTENNLAKQLVLVNSQYQVKHRILDTAEPAKPKMSRDRRLVEA